MTDYATLAGGCFWCTEAVFKDVIGVESVESGYIGGHHRRPHLSSQVCDGDTGHAEAIRDRLRSRASWRYWATCSTSSSPRTIRPSSTARATTSARSIARAIFPADAHQEQEAKYRDRGTRAGGLRANPIVTTIEPMAEWYPAEGYHQDYWETSGRSNPYCMAVIPPKLQKLRKSFAARSRAVSA